MAFSPVAVSSDASPEPGGGGRLGEEADGERRGRLKETAGSSLASLCLGPLSCRRCLRRELRARCRRCRDWLLPAGGTSAAAAPLRTSVVLSQLAEKWFPRECERARTGGRLEELLAQGRFREALGAAGQALRTGEPGAEGEKRRPVSSGWDGEGCARRAVPQRCEVFQVCWEDPGSVAVC